MNFEEILNMPDRAAAYIELVSLYFSETDDGRKFIVDNWDFGVSWDLPNQSRLACKSNERWTCLERIEASLSYSAIAANHVKDYREELIALAVIYQSCVVAVLDARSIFEKVAKISVPSIRIILMDFINRNEEDKSLAAFLLSAEKNVDGEIEIRPAWNIRK